MSEVVVGGNDWSENEQLKVEASQWSTFALSRVQGDLIRKDNEKSTVSYVVKTFSEVEASESVRDAENETNSDWNRSWGRTNPDLETVEKVENWAGLRTSHE